VIEYILFPSSYYSIQKIDEDLQQEYDAVLSTKLFKTIFFGYDQWFHENKIVLTEKPLKKAMTVYRGWMMNPKQYADFYNTLMDYNICLITSPEEYEKCHIFPNVYPEIIQDTARMMVYSDLASIDLWQIKKTFPRFMIKDFVKSVKGTEFPKFFTARVEEEEFKKWMEVFYKYRGSLYTGGICVKEYLDLKTYDGKTNEYRVFVINHRIATICRNSLQPKYTKELPIEFAEKYLHLNSPMYTIDWAELEDGTWKIIEAGDGQVSGLSENQNFETFFRALYYSFLSEE